MKLVCTLLLVFVVADVAEARWRLRRSARPQVRNVSRVSSHASSLQSVVVPQSGSMQAVAQAEADTMARSGRCGHIDGCPRGARFEGVGCSSNPNAIPTCTPRSRMSLIADARAQGRNGMWYRVRLWR